MLGRSKLETNSCAPPSASRWKISVRVMASAVAVSAMRGTPGKCCVISARRRYSGRKSCPHWLHAVSLVDREQRDAAAVRDLLSTARNEGSSSRSGATYSRSSSPALQRARMAAVSSADDVEFQYAARTPSSRNASTWSCMSAMSGDTTMPTPGRSSAGSW